MNYLVLRDHLKINFIFFQKYFSILLKFYCVDYTHMLQVYKRHKKY